MASRCRAHVLVSGIVQGVGFRAWVALNAQRLGLTGWVRNCRDGRVEAVFEGPQELVKQMCGEIEHGPRGAMVEKVSCHFEESTDEFLDFNVKSDG